MSEYQYYEFAAIDQPLSQAQQETLRGYSSRARISAGGFSNEYHWGDLKGEPLDWMLHFFDAHVYSAGWGTCRLIFRIPQDCFTRQTLADYAITSQRDCGAFEARQQGSYWFLDWSFEDDSGSRERFWSHEDGPGWLGGLQALREELLRGDLRPLYLGWLARVSQGQIADDALEPPVPAGLQTLSAAQQTLADFLEIDPDWIAAAAMTSAPLPAEGHNDALINAWLETLPPERMRDALRVILRGERAAVERALHQQFHGWLEAGRTPPAEAVRRSVAVLEQVREQAEAARLVREREVQLQAEAARQKEYERFLDQLVLREDAAWAAVERGLARGSGAGYDEATRLLVQLSAALLRADKKTRFDAGLQDLLVRHATRKAWLKRLVAAGLLKDGVGR